MTPTTRHILVLCTGNSARSQMAEGWFRHLGGGTVTVAKTGGAPAGAPGGADRAFRMR